MDLLNVLALREKKFILMFVNILSVGLLFKIFDLLFRFVKFSLIYYKLYFYWDLYTTFYSFIVLVFCSFWLFTSFRFSINFWRKKVL